MQSPPWHRALSTWATQYFPGEPLLVASGDPTGHWSIARTADPNARERPIIVTPVTLPHDALAVVRAAHRSAHPVVAMLDGARWVVSLVRWRGPGQAELGSPIQLPRPSAEASKQVDAILRGGKKPRRPKKKKK